MSHPKDIWYLQTHRPLVTPLSHTIITVHGLWVYKYHMDLLNANRHTLALELCCQETTYFAKRFSHFFCDPLQWQI